MAVVLTVVGKYNGKDLAKAEAQLQKLKKEAQAAASPFTRLGDAFDKAGKKIAGVGSTVTKKVTVPLAGMAAAAGYAYAQVDEGLDTVAARSGVTGQALAGLQESFKTVARGATQDMTTVGEVVGDLAGRLNLTGKPLETLSTRILDFARITGTDAKTATDAVSKAMVGLGVSAGKSGEFLDLLLVASQKSGVGVDKLAATLAATGPTFRTMGFDTEQATSFIAAFERAGLPATRMISGMNTAAGKLAKQGVKDIPGAMQAAIDKIKNAGSAADATRIAVGLFGSRAGVALADSIRNGTLSVEDLNAALRDSKGALDTAKKATDGPSESLARLKNNFMLAGASIADAVVPTLEKLVPILQGMAEKFANLNPGVKTAIVVAGGLAAALGPILVVVGNVTRVVGLMSKAIAFAGMVQKAFTGEVVASTAAQKIAAIATKVWTGIQVAFNAVMSANPIVLVGLAIAALVAGVIIAYKKFDWFRDLVDKVGHALKVGFVAAWNAVKSAVGSVVNFLVGLWDRLKGAGSTLVNAYAAYFRLWRDILTTLVGWVTDGVGKILGFFRDIPGKLAELPGRMIDIGKNIVTGIWDGIRGAGSWLMGKIKEWALSVIPGWMKKVLGIASPSKVTAEIGGFVAKGLAVGIDNNSATVKYSSAQLAKGVVSTLGMEFKKGKGKANEYAKTLADAMVEGATKRLDDLKKKAQEVLDFAAGIGSQMRSFGSVAGFDTENEKNPTTGQNILADMRARVEAVKKFGQNLSALKGLGLNTSSLQEIISAGPTVGNAIAEALLKEGSSAIGEVNSLESALSSSAGSIGDLGAQSAYGQSVADAGAIVNSTLSFAPGSIVVNVGAGATPETAAAVHDAITAAINEAATTAAEDALSSVAKAVKTGKRTNPPAPTPKPKPKPRSSSRPNTVGAGRYSGKTIR